jgi:hypothetical protein
VESYFRVPALPLRFGAGQSKVPSYRVVAQAAAALPDEQVRNLSCIVQHPGHSPGRQERNLFAVHSMPEEAPFASGLGVGAGFCTTTRLQRQGSDTGHGRHQGDKCLTISGELGATCLRANAELRDRKAQRTSLLSRNLVP